MKNVEVAIGILQSGRSVLLAQRKQGQTFADKWEFPGGKVESGESPQQALVREFREEIGIETSGWQPFLEVPWQYQLEEGVLNLTLHSFILKQHRKPIESAMGAEGQPLKWVSISALSATDFPEANQLIIQQLKS